MCATRPSASGPVPPRRLKCDSIKRVRLPADDHEALHATRAATRALGGLERDFAPDRTDDMDWQNRSTEAPILAEHHVCAAVTLNRYAAHHAETRVGASPNSTAAAPASPRISAPQRL